MADLIEESFESLQAPSNSNSGQGSFAAQLISKLISLGSCARCILRYTNCKHGFAYFLDEQQLFDRFKSYLEKNGIIDVPSHTQTSPCVMCARMLQGAIGEKYLSIVKERITSCEHERNSTFMLNFNISVIPHWRDRVVQRFLESENLLPFKFLNFKETFKLIFCTNMPGLSYDPSSAFSIVLQFIYPSEIVNKDLEPLFKMAPKLGSVKPVRARQKRRRKEDPNVSFIRDYEVSIGNVTALSSKLSEADLKAAGLFPPPPPLENAQTIECKLMVEFLNQHLYVADLSQSPWIVEGARKGESSVEEEICRFIVPYFMPKDYNFITAGREDFDVRMLGDGRPFVLELINPKRVVGSGGNRILTDLENTSNQSSVAVKLRDLQIVDKEATRIISHDDGNKKKYYRAVIWLSKPITEDEMQKINTISDMVINQRTPVRVSHRRALLKRKRTIYKVRISAINSNFYYLDLQTQAGTYIKELVHGDFGRTSPSIREILECDADILQLDVTCVDLNFPQRTSPHNPVPFSF